MIMKQGGSEASFVAPATAVLPRCGMTRPSLRRRLPTWRSVLLIAEPSTAWWNTPSEVGRQYQREYDARPASRAKRLASQRRYLAKPEAHAKKLARQRAYYYRHRENRLDVQRGVNYRIPRGTYEAVFIQQQGRCAICRRAERGRYKGRLKNLAVDHDHGTGQIRALLCQDCNRGIGSFRHDPDRLRAAIAYLRRHSTSFINSFTTHAIEADLGSRFSSRSSLERDLVRDAPGSPSPASDLHRAAPRWRR